MRTILYVAAVGLITLLVGVFIQFGTGGLLIVAGGLAFAGALLVEIE